jgi:hypothetical protein
MGMEIENRRAICASVSPSATKPASSRSLGPDRMHDPSLELDHRGRSQGPVIVAAGRLVETYGDLPWHDPIRMSVVDRGALSRSPPPVCMRFEASTSRSLNVPVYPPPSKSMTACQSDPRLKLSRYCPTWNAGAPGPTRAVSTARQLQVAAGGERSSADCSCRTF